MGDTLAVLATTLASVLLLMFLLWLVSLALKDASIVVSFWGVGFTAIAWICFAITNGYAPRKLIITTLVTGRLCLP